MENGRAIVCRGFDWLYLQQVEMAVIFVGKKKEICSRKLSFLSYDIKQILI